MIVDKKNQKTNKPPIKFRVTELSCAYLGSVEWNPQNWKGADRQVREKVVDVLKYVRRGKLE